MAKAKGRTLTTAYGQRGHEAARAQRRSGTVDVVAGSILTSVGVLTSEAGLGLALTTVGGLNTASGLSQRAKARSKAAKSTAIETLIQRSRGGSAALASKGVDASKTRGLTSKSQNRSDYRNGLLELAGGQRINNANANPASRARERVRMGIEAAPLNRGLSASQKSDYAKATQAHKAAAEKRASSKPASDGMTDAYVRTQNGKTVQVGGYRTVLPK